MSKNVILLCGLNMAVDQILYDQWGENWLSWLSPLMMREVPSETVRAKMKESHKRAPAFIDIQRPKSTTCPNAHLQVYYFELLKKTIGTWDMWIVWSQWKSFPACLRMHWSWFSFPIWTFFLTGLKIVWINSKRSGWRRRPSPPKSLNLTIDYWEFMWHGSWSDGEPQYLETIGREGTVLTSLHATAWTYERRSSTSGFLLLGLLQPERHGSDITWTKRRRYLQIDGMRELLPPRAASEVHKQVNNIISAGGTFRGQQPEEHQHKEGKRTTFCHGRKIKWPFC